MTQLLDQLSRSNSVKLASIGALALLLLIPTAMIDNVIRERAQLADVAREDIMNSWGRQQSLAGPILSVPYRHIVSNKHGPARTASGVAYYLPRVATFDVQVNSQLRYRGIYTVPVYEATIRVDAQFVAIPANTPGLANAEFDYDRAQLIVALDDPRTLRETPLALVNKKEIPFEAGSAGLDRFGPHIVAPIGEMNVSGQRLTFGATLKFAGTDALRIAPVGDASEIVMTSNWANPSFQGPYLPAQRHIDDDGFEASWQITSLGRTYPAIWVNNSVDKNVLASSFFGVAFKAKLNTYDIASRAVRYAILTIALTFACFFLFEIVSALHLHPVQYLLVGFANCLFFLLLLTLSEYIGFVGAYVLSAAASICLIGGYAAAILRARARAAVCVAVLLTLYAFVFMTLRAQNFALLAGSIGLWVVLGALMYFTRQVDWHATAERHADAA